MIHIFPTKAIDLIVSHYLVCLRPRIHSHRKEGNVGSPFSYTLDFHVDFIEIHIYDDSSFCCDVEIDEDNTN